MTNGKMSGSDASYSQGYTAPTFSLTLPYSGCYRTLVMKIAVVLVLLCLILGACGQKGPLYLPQPNKPQPDAPAPQAEQLQTEVDQPQVNRSATPVE